MTARTFCFTVDNQLLSELGERLVAKNYIALAELIKNAYDADAERVTVSLNMAAPSDGEIVISDFGHGMTAAQVEKYWLRRSLVDVSIARPERRKGYEPDPGFSVVLTSDEFTTKDAQLSEQYLNSGWGRLKSTVSKNGSVGLELKAKGVGARSFELSTRFSYCNGIDLDIAWIPGEKEHWRDPKLMTNAVRRQLEDTEGGVKVYCDGFRVYPYGESGTDWLDISRTLARRVGGVDKMFHGIATKLGVDPTRALLDHPKETTLVGRVIIPPSSADQFVTKMDREGFVENDAYHELQHLVQMALQWMTVQYVNYKQRAAEERLEEEASALPILDTDTGATGTSGTRSPQAALNAAIALVEKVGQKGLDAVPGRGRTLSTAANVIRRSADVMDARLAKLQILASTGPVVFAFAHEIKSLIARLATHANEMESIAKTLKGKRGNRLARVADDLRDTRKRLDHEVELFGIFSRSLAEDKPSRHPVRGVVDEVVAGFSYLAESFDIKVDLSGLEVKAKTEPMRSAEIYSVIVNLISNALKSCMASGGKLIGVTAKRYEKGLIVRIMDTGVGLDEGYWERAFEPLVADPQNKIYRRLEKLIEDEDVRALGLGSGLGLSIVRDIVTARGGRVRFIRAKRPWRACVEVVLP